MVIYFASREKIGRNGDASCRYRKSTEADLQVFVVDSPDGCISLCEETRKLVKVAVSLVKVDT